MEFSSEAVRDLQFLETEAAKRIVKKLESITPYPQRHLSKIVGADDYKLRIGDYRVIIILVHGSKTIFVERVGHRKNVYKSLR